MEENQVPNPEQQNNNVSGEQKPKKKMGPVKGLLLAILIVFLLCVVGLLIRMVVAGDGDYFKPIKEIFGIEEKEDKKSSKSSKGGESSAKSAARYALLSSDTEGENVKHYRLTLDMGEYFSKIMEEYANTANDFSSDDYNYDEEDYSYNEDDYNYDANYNYNEEDYSTDYTDDSYLDDSTSSTNELENMMGTAMLMMQMMGDMIDGEMYLDIYFEGNEIVQIVIGYDYAEFAKNVYDYSVEADGESMKDEGIKSFDDFLEYMNMQMSTALDKDEICKAIMESMDEETKNELSAMGIKEKDIKELIDFNCDKGIFEMYINGTTKLKALVSMGLESDSFKEELNALEEEANVTIDEENIIESILEASNETDTYAEYGIEFIEVK